VPAGCWQQLPFYAEHHVDEILLVDPDERALTWLQRHDGDYEPVQRSQLIDLGAAELADRSTGPDGARWQPTRARPDAPVPVTSPSATADRVPG
jgi:hypothetical protein